MKKDENKQLMEDIQVKLHNVNASLIKSILEQGYTPVISPIAISEESDFLNVDGDRAAANIAGQVKN